MRPDLRIVAYVEREAYACEILATRGEEEALDSAPIWTDCSSFNARPFRGLVDLILGGFPCQDVSNAGKRAGLAGARSGLWKQFKRIIEESQPRLVFIENVSALRSRGLDEVLTDLASLGFDAEWSTLRAADVGATHGRDRVFILANAQRSGGKRRRRQETEEEREAAEHSGATLADADGAGQQQQRSRRLFDGIRQALGSHADGRSGERLWPAGPEAPPMPSGKILNPRFVEHLMGWPIGWSDCDSPVTEWFLLRLPTLGGNSRFDSGA